jgi:nucleoside-diphosphate-sugar epimerase
MRTLLIAGFGDIARRAMPSLQARNWRVLALVRDAEQAKRARAQGATPIVADLDRRASLDRLAGLACAVLYTAPPPATGQHDPRLLNLLSALGKGDSIPQRWVYISTSGVYGDHGGAWVDETSPLRATTGRALRRIAAERLLRAQTHRWPMAVTILRAPGIYAADRLPLERIRQRTPVALQADDNLGNHIHADDLAALCVRALERRSGPRVFNACDDSPIASGDWFCLLADHFSLPRPPRLARQALLAALTPLQASFLTESRRLDNDRLHHELGMKLSYPSVHDYLARHATVLAEEDKIR